MIDKAILKKTFGKPLADAGFSREGTTWRKVLAEVCQVVNLQKSDWSEEYFVNLAINIPKISGREYLPEHKCQIRLRAGRAFPDRQPSVEEVMALDSNLERTQHMEEVCNLSSDIVSLMTGFESLTELANIYNRGVYKNMAVMVSAQEILSAARQK